MVIALRTFRYKLLLVFASLACRRTPSTTPHATATSRAVVDVPAPIDVAEQLHVARRFPPPPGLPRPDAGAMPVRRTTLAHTTSMNTEDPWALVPTADGALWVRAVNVPGQRASEIQATLFDRDGNSRGASRLLRRTTGPVRAVSVDAQGPHVWIAWHTVREGERREEHIVVAMHGNADLTQVGAPVTIANFARTTTTDLPYAWDGVMVRVFVRDDGGALAVSTGARAVCVHGDDDEGEHSERVPCEGWNVTQIEPSGTRQVHVETLLCPSSLPHGFVRIPGGIAYAVVDDHIGTKLALFTAATGSATPMEVPTEAWLWNYRNTAMAWGDGSFVLAANSTGDISPSTHEGARGVLVRGPSADARSPMLRDTFGSPMLPALRRGALRCEEGHPVVRVQWAGNHAQGVTLDVTHAGTSLNLADWVDVERLPLPSQLTHRPTELVWTGAAILGVANGTPLRWTCPPSGPPRFAPQ
jgi:hypothetical protein